MTNEEDAANEQDNARIRDCEHDPRFTINGVWCFLCGAQFAVILKPRLAKAVPFDVEKEP